MTQQRLLVNFWRARVSIRIRRLDAVVASAVAPRVVEVRPRLQLLRDALVRELSLLVPYQVGEAPAGATNDPPETVVVNVAHVNETHLHVAKEKAI